jgi:hypothetical protein
MICAVVTWLSEVGKSKGKKKIKFFRIPVRLYVYAALDNVSWTRTLLYSLCAQQQRCCGLPVEM